jgi:glyoxylase-like metal-dependent hydrolase (beta-lactamase superfamily II)
MINYQKAEFVEVAPGVYAFIQGKGEWFVSNAGLIIGDEYAIVVDSLANERMVKRFIGEIKKATNKKIRLLINTHSHGDHIWTNHFFSEAMTICQTLCREETVMQMNIPPQMAAAVFPQIETEGARSIPQDIVFERQLIIYLDPDRPVQLVYVGPAHTNAGDSYVYLPKLGVVFCGDLLFAAPCTPFALFGHIPGYIKAIEELASLDADVYVPGHGRIAGKQELYVARDYLSFIYNEAQKRFEKGMSVSDAARDIDLGPYKEWGEAERVVGNVARAYSEFRGDPPGIFLPDIMEVIKDMMEYARERSK